MTSQSLIIRKPDKINAGNCNNPAPPPEIAEKVLEKNDIKKI
jgi:hypothetical protein